MVDLDKLKEEITTLGETIKTLKQSNPSDTDAIGTAVASLLVAKQLYADHNDGMGIDGLPYTTNKDKKSKNKKQTSSSSTTADAVTETISSSSQQQEADPNSKGAQKKAAKKAAAAAKRAELKQQSQSGVVTTTTSSATAAVDIVVSPGSTTTTETTATATTATKNGVNQNSDTVKEGRKITTTTAVPKSTPMALYSTKMPLPNQMIINPNVPLNERPIVAISVVVLLNTICDYQLVSDHKCRTAMLGTTTMNQTIIGDLAMARYIIQSCHHPSNLYPIQTNPEMTAMMNIWIDYAQTISLLPVQQRWDDVCVTLEQYFHTSSTQTYLVGHTLSLADIAIFAVMNFVTQIHDYQQCVSYLPKQAVMTRRWLQMMVYHPALQEATQLCLGVAGNVEAIFDDCTIIEPLVSGMNALEGAIPGRVVTRFPPEPSGYLHIGHAKAVLLNDYYAKRYHGRLIVRFDDTNPSKEKEEYQESIVQDLAKLGVQPDVMSFTSDYFDTCIGYAKFMIQNGLAYMDDTPQEVMKVERNDRKDSIHRNQTPDDAMKFFDMMCSGSEEGGKWCLRARIDMKSDNGTMRDPVLFRQNLIPHHRTGTKYKAYPTYDLACPIVDSIEGVTHALRTTEYDDRNAQYQWIQKSLGLRRVRVHTFSKVNFKNTVLSKRKLTWFVENGHVTGWDDARFPTIRGVIRRGINVKALRDFMYSQGSSKRIVLMDWTVFWSENKKEIDIAAKRYMAINPNGNNAKLFITNVPSESDYAFVTTSCHPKQPNLGTRVLRIANRVLLETVDVDGLKVGENIVLMRWGLVTITKVDHETKVFEGEFVPDGDFKTTKRILSWLADVSSNIPVTLMEFDNLISKDKIEEDENFEDFINPNTLASTDVIGDGGLKMLRENDIIQLERRGYYRVDRPYISDSKPLLLYMIPDGKSKSMSGQTGKLAHR